MTAPIHPGEAQTVVLLGASNMARGFPTILRLLQTHMNGPLDIMAAMGHGRSYGAWSRFMVRALPGINPCGLWDHLADSPEGHRRISAAVADVGNDLMYGRSAEELLGWLDISLQRLKQAGAELTLVSLPVCSLKHLSPARFEVIRRLIFPRQGLTWSALQPRIRHLDAGMRELAQRHGAHWIEAQPDWFGWDPIHIRPSHQVRAWRSIFGPWSAWQPETTATPIKSPLQWAARTCRPAERIWFGRHQRTPQPVLHQGDLRLFLF